MVLLRFEKQKFQPSQLWLKSTPYELERRISRSDYQISC